MFRYVDTFRYEIISFLRSRRAVRKLFDAIQAIITHLIGRYENGLCLMIAPIVESFIVETSGIFFEVAFCSFVGNIAVDYAIFWDFDLGIIKNT